MMPLATLTLTAADTLLLPAASRATAVRPCVPSEAVVVSQEIEYGPVASSGPRLAPSSLNCTPTTPTLSLAFAVTRTASDTLAFAAGEVIDTDGGVASPTGIEYRISRYGRRLAFAFSMLAK